MPSGRILNPIQYLLDLEPSASTRQLLNKSTRGRFYQAAAARKVNASSPPAGVSSKRRPLEKSTVRVPPRAFFVQAAAFRGCFSKLRLLDQSTVQVHPRVFVFAAGAARKVHGVSPTAGVFRSGGCSKSPQFKSARCFFRAATAQKVHDQGLPRAFLPAAARKVHTSSRCAGVFSRSTLSFSLRAKEKT